MTLSFTKVAPKESAVPLKRYKISQRLLSNFRYADRIRFSYDGEHAIEFIVCPKSHSQKETATKIDCLGFFTFTFEPFKVKACSYTVERANIDWKFQTIAGSLQVGQEFELHWEVDALYTPELEKLGLYGDTLTMVVYSGKRHQRHFAIGSRVGSNPLSMITR